MSDCENTVAFWLITSDPVVVSLTSHQNSFVDVLWGPWNLKPLEISSRISTTLLKGR